MADRHSRINRIYRKMIQRCQLPTEPNYAQYGANGVTVCAEWQSYKQFKEDMLPTYRDGLTLDRIDNSKGYSKENCRWATMEEQQNNRTNNRNFTLNNETMTLSRWARKLGVNRSVLSMRFYVYKWSVERTLMTPIRKRG